MFLSSSKRWVPDRSTTRNMDYQRYNLSFSRNWGPTTIGFAVIGVLGTFWTSVALESIGITLPLIRELTGLALLLFVPGVLLTQLFGLETNRLGELVTFSIGISLACLSVIVVLSSVLLPHVGISDPISLRPFGIVLSMFVLVLALAAWRSGIEFSQRRINIRESGPILVLSALLLILAVAGAVMRNRTGNAYGIGLFVIVAATAVVLVSTRFVRSSSYPAFLLALSLSTLLHRNLVTNHIVGEDVQYAYFVSSLITETHLWYPDFGGTVASIPLVIGVPATYVVFAGLELTLAYKIINSLVFSFVPLGIYYLATDIFDEELALYGSLFFLFYHYSFYFTPGKQLLSQLFLVLLLLLYGKQDISRTGYAVLGVILATGLIHSHYGMTYVFGFSLLFVAVAFFVVRHVVDGFDRQLPLSYPIVFLIGATLWYGYSSPSLTLQLAVLPLGLLEQIVSLAAGAPVGAGSTYVGQQTGILEQLILVIYALCLFLICIAILWRTIEYLRGGFDSAGAGDLELTALAIPFVAFLASSYVVIFNLYADRVYQMVLPVVAPFLGFGFSLVYVNRARLRGSIQPNWSVLAVVLAALLVLNSGLAFAAVGSAQDYTFNENAQDYAFSDEEVAAAEWLQSQPDIEPVDPGSTPDEDEFVRIYTDPYSYQLFRSIVPEGFYNVHIIMLKDQWDPTFDPDETTDGYVFVRHNGIVDSDDRSGPVTITHLDSRNVSTLMDDRTVGFENEDVTILEPKSETTTDDNA